MGDLDRTTMTPPLLRLVERTSTPAGDAVLKWELRITQPNIAQVPAGTLHSLQHFLDAHFVQNDAPVILVAPLGCLTGLCLVAIDVDEFEPMARLVDGALRPILAATAVPRANPVDCGAARMHSLDAAQQAAALLLQRRAEWSTSTYHDGND